MKDRTSVTKVNFRMEALSCLVIPGGQGIEAVCKYIFPFVDDNPDDDMMMRQ